MNTLTENKRVIWSYDISENEYLDPLTDEVLDLDNYDHYETALDMNYSELDEIRFSLDENQPFLIVALADLGLWNGRVSAAKIIGNNYAYIFSSEYDPEWYVEDGDLKCRESHHDGTNYITYKKVKPDITNFEAEELLYEAVFENKNIEGFLEPIGEEILAKLNLI